MAGETGDSRSLEETSTWSVAFVCAVFILISIIIEHGIQHLGRWFQKRDKKAMFEALEKIKSELMLLGFISLLLTFGTTYVTKICVPKSIGNKWHPCDKDLTHKYSDDDSDDKGDKGHRKLMSYAQEMVLRRSLAAADTEVDHCAKNDKMSLISSSGVHQLHIFIFLLALMHVFYSVVLMLLGHAKMNKWKAWELETSSLEYQFTNDPARFRLAHQTSFVKRHAGIYSKPGIRWIAAFFRQFFGSISKVDYMAIRNAFINAHFSQNTKFDFHKYIKRSMQDDYKSVLGISVPLWIFALLFLLVNFYQWHTLAWISLVPLIIILLVGMKLELVIMEMAEQISDRASVVRGAPLVQTSNNFFWFNRPQWILFLIHFTLFENAYQLAYFLWKWYEFGITSCFHEKLVVILIRVFVGVALQITCSYITFPLYSLVTQMGSNMKKSIFEEQTTKALMKWREAAKQRKRQRQPGMDGSVSGFTSGNVTPSRDSSPIHLLHNNKYRSNAPETESIPDSPLSYVSDNELSELELANRGNPEAHRERERETHNIDFSFSNSELVQTKF